MAKVRKRSWTYKGINKTAWVVGYKDQKGKQRLKTFKKKKEADSFLVEVQHEIKRGIHTPDSESVTVAEAAEIWLEACKRGRDGREPVESATLHQYESHVTWHINPLVGKERLNTLSGPRVAKFRDDLLGSCSRALAKKAFTSFKSILMEAQARGLVAKNPAAGVKLRTSDRHKEEITIPSRSEVKKILGKLDELATQKNKQRSKRWKRWRALIQCAAFTGMRASELRGLVWEHVDFEAGIIKVRQRADEKGQIGPVKTAAGVRDIPIPDHLVVLLREWKVASPHGQLVFPNWQGNPESLANIFNRAWKPLLERSGLRHFNFHALRHFHASILIASDANPKEVQTEMGHSSIKVTYDIYGKLFPEDFESRKRRAQRMASEVL